MQVKNAMINRAGETSSIAVSCLIANPHPLRSLTRVGEGQYRLVYNIVDYEGKPRYELEVNIDIEAVKLGRYHYIRVSLDQPLPSVLLTLLGLLDVHTVFSAVETVWEDGNPVGYLSLADPKLLANLNRQLEGKPKINYEALLFPDDWELFAPTDEGILLQRDFSVQPGTVLYRPASEEAIKWLELVAKKRELYAAIHKDVDGYPNNLSEPVMQVHGIFSKLLDAADAGIIDEIERLR